MTAASLTDNFTGLQQCMPNVPQGTQAGEKAGGGTDDALQAGFKTGDKVTSEEPGRFSRMMTRLSAFRKSLHSGDSKISSQLADKEAEKARLGRKADRLMAFGDMLGLGTFFGGPFVGAATIICSESLLGEAMGTPIGWLVAGGIMTAAFVTSWQLSKKALKLRKAAESM